MGDHIPFQLIEQKEPTSRLAIILPGAGYTTHKPLLYYTTSVLYNEGFDVLHVNYKYDSKELANLSEEDFTRDIQLVIDNATKDRQYDSFILVAKSLGTIALSHLINFPLFKEAKVVWMTPLLQKDDVYQAMLTSGQKGLCVIGDADYCFIEDRFSELKKKANLSTMVVQGGNHSLELINDPISSIERLADVMKEIQEFAVADVDVFPTEEQE